MLADLPYYVALALGAILLLGGLVLALRGAVSTNVSMLLLSGLGLVAIGAQVVAAFSWKGIDIKTFHNASEDVTAKIAGLEGKATGIEQALAKQVSFNDSVQKSLGAIEKNINTGSVAITKLTLPDITVVSPQVMENRKFSVLIFYKNSRKTDADILVRDLLKVGYQAAATESALAEVPIGWLTSPPEPGEVAVQPSKQDGPGSRVFDIVKSALPEKKIDLWKASALRRGDVQIYMF